MALERESDIQKFLNDLPQRMVNRDDLLERDNQRENRNSEPVTGRMGSLAQWELIVEFYSEYFGLTKSFYSGEELISLQRAGMSMLSFQRSDDTQYYFENFLRWMLYICSSMEQRIFPKSICQTKVLKDEHLALIVKLWDEGRGSHKEMPESPVRELSKAENDGIIKKHYNQKHQAAARNQRERQGDEKKLLEYCRTNFLSKTLWSLGDWKPSTTEVPNSLLLSIDSMVNKSKYDYEASTHFAEYWWMNDAMESLTKSYESEFIRQDSRLRKRENREELEQLVRAKEAKVGEEKYEIFASIFGRMAAFIREGTRARRGIWNRNFAGDTKYAFIKFLASKGLSFQKFL